MKNKPVNSIRVAYENWLDEKRFTRLLALLDEYPCAISDVLLFTSATHTPLTLAELERRINIVKDRLPEVRAHGFRAGINMLATIGHHPEDLDHSLTGAYAHMTNVFGAECGGSYCMNDKSYLDSYVIPAYTLLAGASPDILWVDDDIRYDHIPIGNGCFCDGCIAKFNRENGTSYTRETLRSALNDHNIALRMKWLEHNSEAMRRLFRVIGSTVRRISDKITLGFMTGERYFEGYDFAGYAAALSDGGKYEILWRPGGGAYTDISFDGFVAKAQDIGRQNAYLPDYVTGIQSEIENFPYQLIKKTAKSTASEAALYMTSGCTGAAFNILPSESGEPIDNCIPHLKAINKVAEFYSLLHEKLSGMKPRGIHSGWKPYSQAALPECEWSTASGGRFASYSRELFNLGMPECFNENFADVFTLSGCGAAVMSDEEIKDILTRGVYLDADALEYLNGRGFSEDTGFLKGKAVPVDAREVYTDIPLNQGIAGCIHNCRQAFHEGMSVGIVPNSEGSVSAARLEDYHGNIMAECSLGVFDNRLGGHTAAAGYYPFAWISDAPKAAQLKKLFVYLSGGKLISYVDTYCRVRNVTFTGSGKICVTLFNISNDTLEDIDVMVQTDQDAADLYDMRCVHTKLRAVPAPLSEHAYRRFTVSEILPYEMVLIEI